MAKDDIRYVPSNRKAPYREIMNGKPVQRLLSDLARDVQYACIDQDIYPHMDVRPGKMRAHAIVSANRWNYKPSYRKKDRANRVKNLHAYTHNQRVDRVILAALDSVFGR